MEVNNTKLQIERILFFSDAVMAIAMTLLIIEIKAPHLHSDSEDEIIKIINGLIPKFISFFVSFFVIALHWKAHHNLFGYLTKYTDKLIWLNLLFLLSIVLMPFSTAFYSENFQQDLPYAVYCINIIIAGLLNCWLVLYISSKKGNLSVLAGNTAWRKIYTMRSLVAPLVFLLSVLLARYSIGLSRLSFILIFPIIYLLNRMYKRTGIKHSKR